MGLGRLEKTSATAEDVVDDTLDLKKAKPEFENREMCTF